MDYVSTHKLSTGEIGFHKVSGGVRDGIQEKLEL